MLEMILTGDKASIMTAVVVRAVVVFVAWLMIVGACFVDMWSGCSAAKACGQKLNSHGFAKTLHKIRDYFMVSLVGLMIDIVGSIFTWYELPYGTIIFAIAVILIEGRSVFENAKRKKSAAAMIPTIINEIVDATDAKSATAIFRKIGALVDAVNKNEKWTNKEEAEESA